MCHYVCAGTDLLVYVSLCVCRYWPVCVSLCVCRWHAGSARNDETVPAGCRRQVWQHVQLHRQMKLDWRVVCCGVEGGREGGRNLVHVWNFIAKGQYIYLFVSLLFMPIFVFCFCFVHHVSLLEKNSKLWLKHDTLQPFSVGVFFLFFVFCLFVYFSAFSFHDQNGKCMNRDVSVFKWEEWLWKSKPLHAHVVVEEG